VRGDSGTGVACALPGFKKFCKKIYFDLVLSGGPI